MTATFILYILCQIIFRLAICEDCKPNNIIKSFEIIHPPPKTLVPWVVFAKVSGTVYNATYVQAHSSAFELCFGIKGSEKCGFSGFDEIQVNFQNSGEVKLVASFCLINHECYCHSEITVECCTEEENTKALAQQKVDARIKSILSKNNIIPSVESSADANPWLCRNHLGLEYIIGVKSNSLHFDQRQHVRNSWMRKFSIYWKTYNICSFFILGETEHDEIKPLLAQESLVYGDTLLGDVIQTLDSYDNLPSKSTLFMKYVMKVYHQTHGHPGSSGGLKYIIIIDDDVYLRLPCLVTLLQHSPLTRYYAGEV